MTIMRPGASDWRRLASAMPTACAAVRTRSTLSSRSPQCLDHPSRPPSGGLTIMTQLLGGARFVDGVYVPPVEAVSAV